MADTTLLSHQPSLQQWCIWCKYLLPIALWANLLHAQAAPVPTVVVRFSHVVASNTPKGQMVEQLQKLVQQRSGGRIRLEIYPNSTLYGDDDEMEALQLGAVEMLAPSLSKFSAVGAAGFEVFDLPFLFQNMAQVRCVTQGTIGGKLLQSLSRQQMVGLGFLDNGFKQMSAPHPLKKVQDFGGLRLRIQASRVLSAQMRALGAQPVVLPFGETRQALASGVVDGTENPLSNFLTQRLAPVQRAVTLTDHGYLGYAVVANGQFWAHLGTADRALLTQALLDALQQGNRSSAQINQQARTVLEQTPGTQLHALSVPERQALRRAVQPVHADFERRGGSTLLRQIQRECLHQATEN